MSRFFDYSQYGFSHPTSRKSRVDNRGDFLLPFPDYPGNARCFVHLDARLLPYWHTLFDVCPGLLKLDPPDGLNIFRSFMTWAYRNHPPLNWTYYLSICRWLLASAYKEQIHEEHIDAFMAVSPLMALVRAGLRSTTSMSVSRALAFCRSRTVPRSVPSRPAVALRPSTLATAQAVTAR